MANSSDKKHTPDRSISQSQHNPPSAWERRYGLAAYSFPDQIKVLTQENRTLIAALASSATSHLSIYPMDTIKAHMQVTLSSSTQKAPSVWQVSENIYKTEGLRGFYRGSVFPTATYCAIRMITFHSYYYLRDNVTDKWWRKVYGKPLIQEVYTPGTMPSFASTGAFAATGAVTGLVVSFLACPFELMKIGSQTAASAQGKSGNGPMMKEIYQSKGPMKASLVFASKIGLKGLYSGIHFHAMRDTVGTGVFWGAYESAKQELRRRGIGDSVSIAVSGGACGVLSYLMTYPFDTAKTNHQRNALFGSAGGFAKSIPWFSRAHYRGLVITLCRVVLANTIQMSLFEGLKSKFGLLDINPPAPTKHDSDGGPFKS